MEKTYFGTLKSGEKIHKYTLKNEFITLTLIDRGATIVSLEFLSKNVVGGFDKLEDYENDVSHQGATIGRVANRIENARLLLDGVSYELTRNNGTSCLHGGVGFDFKLWSVIDYTDESITFSYVSEDGEEGFPSRLYTEVTYLLDGGDVIIDYKARPDGKTPIALTNHAYFNLNGKGCDVFSHKLKIYANEYTEADERLIPTGNRPSVIGTPLDFLDFHEIGERYGNGFCGYDNNFIISANTHKSFFGKKLALAAEVAARDIKMNVYTDQPGIQLYVGAMPSGTDKDGKVLWTKNGAFCLEAQTEPNCVNHGIGIYGEGEIYTQTTVYSFEKNT